MSLFYPYWINYLIIHHNIDMAINETPSPLIELTKEAKDHLEKIGAEIETSMSNLKALEKTGMDVSRLREKIEWAKNARETILKELK
jgi:hypothetical protein